MTRWMVVVIVAAIGGAAQAAERAEEPAPRSYGDGPLTLNDYQAKPPKDGSPLDAYTTTDVLYHISHQFHVAGRRTTAFVTDFAADAVARPSESWIRRPNDKRLLDHEQGHFDLAMITALRLQVHFAQKYKTTRLSATAANADAAVEGLKRKVQGAVQPFFDELREAQLGYDAETRHGLRPKEQAAHREQHQAELKNLTERLRKPDK